MSPITSPEDRSLRDLPVARGGSIRVGRSEASIFFEQRIWATPGLDLLKSYNEEHLRPVSWFHLVVWALARTLDEHPELNRYVLGGRLYQRSGVWVSFPVRRPDDEGGPTLVKQQIPAAASLEEVFSVLQAAIASGRARAAASERRSAAFELLYSWLERWSLLPERWLRDDPHHCSAVISNLGGMGMDAAFLPLRSRGTSPMNLALGRVQDAVVIRDDGLVGARPEVLLRWTFDGRVDDGACCAQALERLRLRLEGRVAGEPLAAFSDAIVPAPPPLRRLGA